MYSAEVENALAQHPAVARLDPIRLGPMIEAIKRAGEKERSELGGPYEIREPRVAYIN